MPRMICDFRYLTNWCLKRSEQPYIEKMSYSIDN